MLPETIKYGKTFLDSAPPSFDGVFDWSFTQGCFGETKITPMDLDGVIERKGNFLVFETKNEGVNIPRGQKILLKSLHDIGVFTIIVLWGKTYPVRAFVKWSKRFGGSQYFIEESVPEKLKIIVSGWFEKSNT